MKTAATIPPSWNLPRTAIKNVNGSRQNEKRHRPYAGLISLLFRVELNPRLASGLDYRSLALTKRRFAFAGTAADTNRENKSADYDPNFFHDASCLSPWKITI